MKKNSVLLLLLIATVSFTILQKRPLQELILGKLENYTLKDYPEKIYIQTDKPYYFINEDIWFTAYLVNGITHKKSEKSRVVYVDLIDSKDNILETKKLYVKNTNAAGNIKIPKDWGTGKYLLRAYTNAMRNQSSDYFFQKEILVSSTEEKEKIEIQKKENTVSKNKDEDFILPRPNLGFYPEGGNLVTGLKNKVAIKIKDSIFSNLPLSGIVYDNENKEITTFKTTDVGLGFLYLTPSKGKTYYASIDINGSEEKYNLPKALAEGFILNVNNKKGAIVIDQKSTLESGLQGTLLVIHQRGQMLFNKLETTSKKRSVFSIPNTNLQDGIIHITLFNSDENPVCERLVFIDNPVNEYKVNIESSKSSYNRRKKVNLQIDVTDVNGKKLASNLSMAVRDLEAVPYNKRTSNIKTWLLLNSDLRGTVKNPGYYFEKENDSKRKFLLDLVMLTNGWRRFTWTTLLDEKSNIEKYTPEKGIHIKGKTTRLNKKYKPVPTATRMTFMGKTVHQEEKRTDSIGYFDYGPYVFYDSIPTVVEARFLNFDTDNESDRRIDIYVDPEAEGPNVSRNVILKPTVNPKSFETFLKVSRYMEEIRFQAEESRRLLDEIVIKARKREKLSARKLEMASRTTHGEPTRRLVMEDIPNGGSLTAIELLSQIQGVFANDQGVQVRNRQPNFLYDGFPVDFNYITGLSGNEIAFIDVLIGNDAAIYSNSANGIIAFYSPTGNLQAAKVTSKKPGIIDIYPKGFYTAKEFFAIDHINGGEETMQKDIRTTLHWEPIIRIDNNLAPILSFFTSDKTGDYIIEIEGISDSGIPIHATSTFVVE